MWQRAWPQGGLEGGSQGEASRTGVAGGEESEGEERGLGFGVGRESWDLPVLEWLSGGGGSVGQPHPHGCVGGS